MKYLSLFAGVGGFDLGIQYAHLAHQGDSRHSGSPESRSQPQPPTCIGYSEIDKYAAAIYRRHFPDRKAYGDITAIDPAALPDFQFMCGGFPCQAFSIAGKRRGFEDTRGTLFLEICRLAEAKRPRLLLLENVKGLLSHDGGRTFYTIIATLDELGYDCQWQLLNGADWVPQNRERVVIVGHLRGTPRPQVFPLRRGDSATAATGGGEAQDGATALTAHHLRYSPDDTYILAQNQRSELREMPIAGALPATLSAKQFQLVNGIRRLTPLECERLMGLPDGWTGYGVNEDGENIRISDTQRYKVCGNGIIPQMVRDVVIPLLQLLNPLGELQIDDATASMSPAR